MARVIPQGPRPPYARALEARIRQGWRPAGGTIHVGAGPDAWRWAAVWREEPGWRAWFIVPDGATYDFRIVRGFDCILWCRGLGAIDAEKLAVDIVHAGAPLVLAYVGTKLVSFRPMRQSA